VKGVQMDHPATDVRQISGMTNLSPRPPASTQPFAIRPFDGLGIAQQFALVARALTEAAQLPVTTQRVVESAVQLIGCSWATIARLYAHGGLTFEAGNDPEMLRRIATIIDDTGQGAAVQANLDRDDVRCDNLTTERRFPAYAARVIAETPIRSLVSYHLQLDERDLGALTLYAPTAGFFTDEVCKLGAIYANHAAIALAFASEYSRADNLECALQTNRKIGIALGIVMATYRLTERQSFDLLRTLSQSTHQKLREVASDVALTGELPDWDRARPPTDAHRLQVSAHGSVTGRPRSPLKATAARRRSAD
jgi:hypothetical protein